MSVEPTCDFCGFRGEAPCQTAREAKVCPHYQIDAVLTTYQGDPAEAAFRSSPASKPTNPKDALAVAKLPLHLVPDTIEAYAALAFAEGASKYGAYNWRVAGVLASVYHSALKRHLASWHNGEEADPVTGVPHLASVIACAGILLDAQLCGKLTDDRPPPADVAGRIRSAEAEVAKIFALFADRAPRHFTIADRAD